MTQSINFMHFNFIDFICDKSSQMQLKELNCSDFLIIFSFINDPVISINLIKNILVLFYHNE